MPTPIFGKINGIGFRMTSSSKAFTWVLKTITNTSMGFMDKGKVQETMASSAPPLMGLGSSVLEHVHSKNL